MEKEKMKTVAIDEDTHTELALMAVRKKSSIKKVLKEMVEEAKKKQTNA